MHLEARRSSVEGACREEVLQSAVTLGGLVDVRIIRDKHTGSCRGFGFLHFNSIADATRSLQELQVFLLNIHACIHACKTLNKAA